MNRSISLSIVLVLAGALSLVACSEKKKAEPETTSEPSNPPPAPAAARQRPSLEGDGVVKSAGPGDGSKRAAYKSKQLAAYDKDGDGQFSADERKTMIAERIDRTFKELDSDGDGLLKLDEIGTSDARMAKRLEKRFSGLDSNGDGALDRDELSGLMTRRGPAGAGPRAPGGAISAPK